MTAQDFLCKASRSASLIGRSSNSGPDVKKNDEKMVLEHAVAALYNSGFAGPVAGISF